MNGRIFDYNVGRFLGVDPFLQFPENSQSANPYSYILNNPMAGTDPTGYLCEGDHCADTIGDANAVANNEAPKDESKPHTKSGEDNENKGKSSYDFSSARKAQNTGSSSSSGSDTGDVVLTPENEKIIKDKMKNMSPSTSKTEEYYTINKDGSSTEPTTEGCDANSCDIEINSKTAVIVHLHNQTPTVNGTKGREIPGPGDHLPVEENRIPNVIITPSGAIRAIEIIDGKTKVRTISGGNRNDKKIIDRKWKPGMKERQMAPLIKEIKSIF